MNTFLNMLISNVFVTACLFAILMVFRRRIKNPAVLHAFLLLILVKLITPAYWQPKLELIPNTSVIETAKVNEEGQIQSPLKSLFSRQKTQNKQPVSQIESASSNDITPTSETITEVVQPKQLVENQKEEDGHAWFVQLKTNSEFRSFVFTRLVMIVWFIGTVGWFLLAVWRITRFQWFLRSAQPASDHVKQMTATLAARIGLKHVPKIEMVDGNISPLLWACFSRARIILPVGLLDQIDKAELETLLLHELAHYRRGDHWVRIVELLVTGVYWWYPIVWLVRRQIRIAEEQCCDAWVVQTLPEKRRSYAEVLVKAIGYISRPTHVTGATGIGSAHVLEQRLKRIMCDSLSGNISRRVKFCVAVIAMILLPFAPMLGQPLTQTVAAKDKETLPTPQEILTGYRANLKKLMPVEMNYRIRTIENMNCVHFDRRELKGAEAFLNLDRSEFNKSINRYFPFGLSQESIQARI
uniref:M56 family metallopeptidase n=1 Tax=uncultured Gimesia sp. TaxID=1678688 RepID=UPI0026339FC0